jgi:uncharacterized membrane protein
MELSLPFAKTTLTHLAGMVGDPAAFWLAVAVIVPLALAALGPVGDGR